MDWKILWLNTGNGILTFVTLEQEIDRVEQLESDYARHCIDVK